VVHVRVLLWLEQGLLLLVTVETRLLCGLCVRAAATLDLARK